MSPKDTIRDENALLGQLLWAYLGLFTLKVRPHIQKMLFLKMVTQVAYIIETVTRIIKATIFTYSIFTTQDGLPVTLELRSKIPI